MKCTTLKKFQRAFQIWNEFWFLTGKTAIKYIPYCVSVVQRVKELEVRIWCRPCQLPIAAGIVALDSGIVRGQTDPNLCALGMKKDTEIRRQLYTDANTVSNLQWTGSLLPIVPSVYRPENGIRPSRRWLQKRPIGDPEREINLFTNWEPVIIWIYALATHVNSNQNQVVKKWLWI